MAFVAGFKRATDEGSLPKIAQYSPSYLPLNVFTLKISTLLYADDLMLISKSKPGLQRCLDKLSLFYTLQ